MNYKIISLIVLFILGNSAFLFSQDLEKLLEEEQKDSIGNEYVEATFKAPRLINGHTVENPARNEMNIFISHRFGNATNGIRDFFGLDQSANIRLGVNYGLNDRLTVGIGHSRFEFYDGFLKYKLIRQQTGKRTIPFTVCILTGIEANTAKAVYDVPNFNVYRFSYSMQLLVASKLTDRLSLQLMPTMVHKNLVKTKADKNNIFAIGGGGRMKISKRVAFCFEYYHVLPNQIAENANNPLSFGFDIETGGHVFQFHLTNALGMTEKSFIDNTPYSWSNTEFVFGFNICRTFAFKKKEIVNIEMSTN